MAREPFPSETQDRFIVRLPDGMRDRIKAAAERNGRSMNSEIVEALLRNYPEPATPEDVIDEVAAILTYFDADLRKAAMGMLAEEAASGRLERRVEIEELVRKHAND